MRDTLISPLKTADIDVFVVLDPKYWTADGQANLLDRVKRLLKKSYPNSPEVSRNGQAVTITFTDFKVDVVPCFYRKDGGYLIPDSHRNQWISTDPLKHITLWTESNKWHAGNLVPLLKMMKAWNKNRNIMPSFALEVAVYKALQNITISDLPSAIRYAFDKMRVSVKSKIADPSGYSDDVAADVTMGAKMDTVVSALETAYTRAKAAEEYASRGNIEAAFERWRLIFGDYFPSYG